MMPKYKPPQKPRREVKYEADFLGDSNVVEVKGSDGSRVYMPYETFEAIREHKP